MAKQTDRGLENREIILGVLTEVLEKGSFVHLVLNQALYKYQYLDKADRAFITRVTEGTLEYMLQLDGVINRYSKTKTNKMKPRIRNLLRMSVYQLLYMDRVPDSAVCNEAVKLAVKHRFQGLKGFVNGVLRTISREKEHISFENPAMRFSVPDWMYDKWVRDWGEERAEIIAASFLEPRPTWVRCNESTVPVSQILKSLQEEGAGAECMEGFDSMIALWGYDYLEGLTAFLEGWIQVQDISSSLVGQLAAPKKGDIIIDVCAAPGGKSLHLADQLKRTGLVEARDLTEQKVSLIEDNIARCGLTNIQTKVWDATVFDPSSEEKADIVIADLPCSGMGIIGRKPDIKYHMTEESLKALEELQRQILSVVWRYVKPGGTLIYSTCTINKGENEKNASWIRGNLPFEPVDIRGKLPEGWEAASSASLQEGQIQILPGIGPWKEFDGFFISVFKRRG